MTKCEGKYTTESSKNKMQAKCTVYYYDTGYSSLQTSDETACAWSTVKTFGAILV